MGLFDEIKRSLEEAINEAQGNPLRPVVARSNSAKAQRNGQRSTPHSGGPRQPAPVPYEDDLETAQSRDQQQRISQRQQQLQEQAQQQQRAKEEARRKEMARREQAQKRARTQEQARLQRPEAERKKRAAQTALSSDNLRTLLQDPAQFKQAVILTEVLGKPIAKRSALSPHVLKNLNAQQKKAAQNHERPFFDRSTLHYLGWKTSRS